MSELWVEKHRPRTVTDIRGQRSVVERLGVYASKGEFPTCSSQDPLALERPPLPWPWPWTCSVKSFAETCSR